MTGLVTLTEIRDAARRIRGLVTRTPLVPMSRAGTLLKAENLQPSGAFKLRGAFNNLLQLSPDERRRGVVAHSSGNHAIAVAMAAGRLGIPATIVMPADAPDVKLAWTRALGATVEVVGPASSERSARAEALATAKGPALVEPYDARPVIAATGTIALEIIEDLAESAGPLELYVPVSGGGLIAGVAAAAKHLDASIRIIGVEPEVAADALASRRAGTRTRLPAEQMARTLADGMRVQIVGLRPWPHIEAFVDDLVTVSEAEILEAMRRTAFEARLIAEPSGAVAIAAALAGRGSAGCPPGRRVAVLSGGNVDPNLLSRVLGSGSDGPVTTP
jgi:threo-3-hydroxy-L-aspartate ammonia-lyase